MENDGFVPEEIQLVNNDHETAHREGIDNEPDGVVVVVREDRVKEKKRNFSYYAYEFCDLAKESCIYVNLLWNLRHHFYLPCISLWSELTY